MENYNLKDRTIQDIEGILAEYPWYAHARKELMVKMSKMGEEYRRDVLRRTALYVYPDYKAFRNAYLLSSRAEENMHKVPEPVYDFGLEEYEADVRLTGGEEATMRILPSSEGPAVEKNKEKTDSPKREIYIVGGDYFSNEDLKQVTGQVSQEIVLEVENKEYKPVVRVDCSEFKDENYYTETLAKIYEEQELYDRAIEIYEKLILLYPEKSAYFAALKDEIKKHL